MIKKIITKFYHYYITLWQYYKIFCQLIVKKLLIMGHFMWDQFNAMII